MNITNRCALTLSRLVLISICVSQGSVLAQTDQPKTATVKTCSGQVISKNIAELLEKFQLDCPIVLPQGTEWYTEVILKNFLADLIKDLIKDYLLKKALAAGPDVISTPITYSPDESPRLSYGSRDMFITLSRSSFDRVFPRLDYEEIDEILVHVRDQISPLFGDRRLDVRVPREGTVLYRRRSLRPDALKPELLTNSKVNSKRVWEEIINAIESVKDLRLDPSSESLADGVHTIKTFPRKVPVEDPGYVVFEEVSVRLNVDDREQSVGILVLSDICRRRLSARNCVQIQISSHGRARRDGLHVYDGFNYSEGPTMEAITTAIKR